MSRRAAREQFTVDHHAASMVGVACDKTAATLDETPDAYKNIDAVMASQTDLVEVVHELKCFVNVKG